MIADHVLSGRHLKLCRLAIGESIGIAGLADTFYQMGICTSRESLIAAVAQVEPCRRMIDLEPSVLADMLFGATVGKVLIDALLTGQGPEMQPIYGSIEQAVASLFIERVSEFPELN